VLGDVFQQLVGLVAKRASISARAATLIVVGLVLGIFAALFSKTGVDASVHGVQFFTLALALLSLIAFVAAVAVTLFPDRIPVLTSEVRAPGGRVLLGIDVGADSVKYGVVRVTSEDLKTLPADRYVRRVGQPQELRVDGDGDRRYERVVEAIVETCKAQAELHGIGLGLPGQIDPALKRIVNPSGPFRHQERFVETLVDRLAAAGPFVFRTLDLPEDSGPEALWDKILVDHHVRCSTRSVLSRYRAEHGWTNFIFLNIDWGVGSGLVLDRRMYYGSSFTAGEVGHMTLHLDDEIADQPGGRRRPIDPCQCQLLGAHWEALVSAGGLLVLARCLDEERYRLLVDGFGGAVGDAEMTPGHVLVACMAVEGRRPEAGSSLPAVSWNGSEDARSYVTDVMGRYAFYLAVGIADLLNVLDLDHVLMGGYVLRALWPLAGVRRPFDSTFRQYVLSEAGRSVQFVDAGDALAWPGAALLWRDPSYELMLEKAGPESAEA
jgi:predicted NBD/HSP70 family sugar kinase